MTTAAPHAPSAPPSHGIAPYVWVFLALLVLLVAAVAVAFIPTEDYRLRAAITTLAYTIAFFKSLLIVLWFMHLKESSRLTWAIASAAFFFVAILMFLTLNDYRSRTMTGPPYSQPPPTHVPGG